MTIGELKPSKKEKVDYLMGLFKTNDKSTIKLLVEYLDDCKFEWEDSNFIKYLLNKRKDTDNKLIKTMDEYQEKMYSSKDTIKWLKDLQNRGMR